MFENDDDMIKEITLWQTFSKLCIKACVGVKIENSGLAKPRKANSLIKKTTKKKNLEQRAALELHCKHGQKTLVSLKGQQRFLRFVKLCKSPSCSDFRASKGCSHRVMDSPATYEPLRPVLVCAVPALTCGSHQIKQDDLSKRNQRAQILNSPSLCRL